MDTSVRDGRCSAPDLIKLDVQGYELEVLRGASLTLKTTEALVLEASFFSFQSGMPLFHDVIEFMADKGFVCYDICGIHPRPLDGAPAQADLLFVRTTSPLRASNRWDKDSIY